MAEHRTKKQKRNARAQRVEHVREPAQPVTTGPLVFTLKQHAAASQKKHVSAAAFQDTEMTTYTKQDLLRTGVVSFILLTVLVGIFQYLRYNG